MARFAPADPERAQFITRWTADGEAFVVTRELVEWLLWNFATNYHINDSVRRLVVDDDSGDLLVVTNRDVVQGEASALLTLAESYEDCSMPAGKRR